MEKGKGKEKRKLIIGKWEEKGRGKKGNGGTEGRMGEGKEG